MNSFPIVVGEIQIQARVCEKCRARIWPEEAFQAHLRKHVLQELHGPMGYEYRFWPTCHRAARPDDFIEGDKISPMCKRCRRRLKLAAVGRANATKKSGRPRTHEVDTDLKGNQLYGGYQRQDERK